jgi:hypothetical protein
MTVSVFEIVGGNAVRVLAAPVFGKSRNITFAQSLSIRLPSIGRWRLRATCQNQKSQSKND